MPPHNESDVASLLKENTVLVRENNRLLKKIHRNAIIEMWLRIVWYAVLIGLPFVLYFYILEPYLETLGTSFKGFRLGVGTFPGLEMLQSLLEVQER